MRLGVLILIVGILACSPSFTGTSIAPDTDTYFVREFTMGEGASLAPPDLGEQFSERMKEKVRRDSRLEFVNGQADVTFSGEVTNYKVVSVAASGLEGSELNRLIIQISVDFEDTITTENSFKKTFSFNADFDKNQNLLDVQDQLIDDIFDDLLEKVFNEAFSNW